MSKMLILLLFFIHFVLNSCNEESNPDDSNTKLTILKIHPIGNSITRGKAGDTYRHYLKSKIEKELQIEVDFVGSCPHAPDSKSNWNDYQAMKDSLNNDLEHDGWGGLKIHQIIDSQNNTQGYPHFKIEDLVTNYPSDIILLMIGTNDIYFNHEVATAPARLNLLISKILDNSNAHLIVSNIPPTVAGEINDRITRYNAQVDSIVNIYHSQGKKIAFVSTNSNMNEQDLMNDKVHPNQSGNKKIADGFFEAINTYIINIKTDSRKSEIPSSFEHYQNYTNPFNSDTTIKFSLQEPAHITLKIYNILGEETITCLWDEYTIGDYMLRLDAANLNSGLYFFKINV